MTGIIAFLAPQEHPHPRSARALRASRWVANAVSERLEAEGFSLLRRPPPKLVRDNWRFDGGRDLEIVGVAFYGHGSAQAVFDEDGRALLDRENASVLAGAWFYAFACEAGADFVKGATPPCTVAVGYVDSIRFDFRGEELSASISDALVDFLAVVPICLAHGRLDEGAMRLELEARADRVVAELDKLDALPEGVQVFIEQQLRGLRIFKA